MKHMSPSDQPSPETGGLRHYHRAGVRRSSWEQWIDGDRNRSGRRWNWLKILGICLALLVLGGIIAGLVIELSRV